MKRTFLLVFTLSALCIPSLAQSKGKWLTHIPDSERNRTNPLTNDSAAVAAGENLYRQHCASCHGEDAGGRGRRPSLHTERVQQATDGELQWLLKNGSLLHGMPAWSGLPEVQRWQLVRYLHSLALEKAGQTSLKR